METIQNIYIYFYFSKSFSCFSFEIKCSRVKCCQIFIFRQVVVRWMAGENAYKAPTRNVFFNLKTSLEVIINVAFSPWQYYRQNSRLYFETNLVVGPRAAFELFKVEIGAFRKLPQWALFQLILEWAKIPTERFAHEILSFKTRQTSYFYLNFWARYGEMGRPGGAVDWHFVRWLKKHLMVKDRIPDRITTLRIEYAITRGMRATM